MTRELVDDYPGLPIKEGLLSISPEIYFARDLSITIVGNREGLRYLAKLLQYMADIDIEKKNLPHGERAHIHLHPGCELIDNSCCVELCRAEAKGTGELPDYFAVEKD